MFLWSSLAHIVLPLGERGVQEIPNEQSVLSAMQTTIGNSSGLYLFPGTGVGRRDEAAENVAMQQYQEKLNNNPSGLLLYHPPGAQALTSSQLVTEFLTELAEFASWSYFC